MITMLKLGLRYAALYYAAQVLTIEAGKVMTQLTEPLLTKLWTPEPEPAPVEPAQTCPSECAEANHPGREHDDWVDDLPITGNTLAATSEHGIYVGPRPRLRPHSEDPDTSDAAGTS